MSEVFRKPPRQFRKKPVVVEAMQWTGDWHTLKDLCAWVNSYDDPDDDHILTYESFKLSDVSDSISRVMVNTLEGPLQVSPGDWIVMGIAGEFYACKPEIFEVTYEPA